MAFTVSARLFRISLILVGGKRYARQCLLTPTDAWQQYLVVFDQWLFRLSSRGMRCSFSSQNSVERRAPIRNWEFRVQIDPKLMASTSFTTSFIEPLFSCHFKLPCFRRCCRVKRVAVHDDDAYHRFGIL